MNVTKEMLNHFIERTNNHINLVKEIYFNSSHHLHFRNELDDEKIQMIDERIENHDNTKFSKELMYYYILITWRYRCIRDGVEFIVPEQIEKEMTNITEIHCKTEAHHPEYWSNESFIINPLDRDKPLKCIDVTSMPYSAIIQMVCDWCAVSVERNSNPRDWFKTNLNIRWHFSDSQVNFINDCINIFWRPYE